MNKKWIIAIVALIIVAAGAATYAFMQGAKDVEPATTTQQPVAEQATESTERSSNAEAPAVEEATLTAVGSYKGSGVATRTISGEYTHSIAATIGDPAEGKFYEGWLVSDAGFVSTGKLVKEAEGAWSLVFTSSDDLSAYTQVVVTEETEANGLDNKPEAHVLEGEF